MVRTSMDYRRAVVQDRIFHARAVMQFPDKTEIVLTNADLMSDGLTIKTGVSSTDSFDIGSASIGECTLRLDNADGRYNTYDFEGAELNVKVTGLNGYQRAYTRQSRENSRVRSSLSQLMTTWRNLTGHIRTAD